MTLEERDIALREKWLEFRKEMFRLKQEENKTKPKETKDKSITPLLGAVLVAIIGFLGSAIATVINNDNQNKLERRKFESELIKKSLEEQTQDNKIKALKLLSTLRLIKDNEVRIALDSFLSDTITAKQELPADENVSVPINIIGRSFLPEDFTSYLGALNFSSWKPDFIVLHSTGLPNLKEWHSVDGKVRLEGMAKFYGSLGWRGGPHLLIADDSIWILNPLIERGIHSPSWNKVSIGVEMVGDYSKELLNPKVRDNTVSAIASLCTTLKINPDLLKLHSEDPLSTRDCPGKNVNKSELILLIKKEIARKRSP